MINNKWKLIIRILASLAGIGAGYLYYIEIGCRSGTCPITSNPWLSMLWGGLAAYLIIDIFLPRNKKQKKNK